MDDSATTRFWAKVNRDGPVHPTLGQCWVWIAATNGPAGYGRFWVSVSQGIELAHRVSYEMHIAPPGELCVLHKCDRRRCVRPDHLFLGTKGDNIRDAVAKGRAFGPPPQLGDRNPQRRDPKRGERHPQAKVTAAQVTEIRRLYREGGCTRAGLALQFGLKKGGISSIVDGRSWTHV